MLQRWRTVLAACGLAAMAIALLGCPSIERGAAGLAGRELFLCCTLRFDAEHESTDANYMYQPETLLTAGTRVRVLADTGNAVRIQPSNEATTYRLRFSYGRGRMSATDWFGLILRDADQRPALALTPAIATAIDEGRLAIGMTKPQALAARGYPPLHRTASVDADEWTYFVSGRVVQKVTFVDNRVARIVNEAAPDD